MGSILPSTDILLYIALSEEFSDLSDELIENIGIELRPVELDEMAITVFCGKIFSTVLNKECHITIVPSGKMDRPFLRMKGKKWLSMLQMISLDQCR